MARTPPQSRPPDNPSAVPPARSSPKPSLSRARARSSEHLVQGPAASAVWVRNSSLAADHAAAGSFETAMQRLNEQVGATNFAPLKPYFLALYHGSRVAVSANASVPGLLFPVHRNWDDGKANASLPYIGLSLPKLVDQLQGAYKLVTAGKFGDALVAFRALLYSALLCVVSTKSDSSEVRWQTASGSDPRARLAHALFSARTRFVLGVRQIAQMVAISREYILGLTIEVARKASNKDDPASMARAAELAAYFTNCNLQPVHLALAIRSAMTLLFKLNNFVTAASLARRLLELAPKPEIAAQVWWRCRGPAQGPPFGSPRPYARARTNPTHTQARKVQEVADRTPRDEVKLNYDEHNPFVVCGASLTPIYRGHKSVACPLCGAHFHPVHKGKLCTICDVATIGAEASGLRNTLDRR